MNTKEFFALHACRLVFVIPRANALGWCFCPFRASVSQSVITLGNDLNFPGKLLDVDDRTILADALVTLGSFLHAAEAGAYTARHLVLQGNLALHTSLLGKASHAHHHRLRSAGRNHIKLLVLQNRVIGNETHLASRAILSSDAYLSYLGKLIQFEQIGSLACTQQEGNFMRNP